MQGFFEKESITEKKKSNCSVCKLYKQCKTPKMEVTGKGRRKILIIGEAPGCISGEALIETPYRDKSIYPNGIPIKQLVGKDNFYVYSFDIPLQKLVLGKVKRVWKTGRKKVYRISYKWWFNTKDKPIIKTDSIEVTSNHLFLLKNCRKKDPFKGRNVNKDIYLSIDGGLTVSHSLQPFYRFNDKNNYGYSHIGTTSSNKQREGRFLLEQKLGRKLKQKEQCHHIDKNKLNDEWENLCPQMIDNHSKLHMNNSINPMHKKEVREKYNKIMQSKEYKQKMSKIMKEKLKDPKIYKARMNQIKETNKARSNTVKKLFQNPSYYYRYLLGRKKYHKWTLEQVRERFTIKFPNEPIPGINNHKISSIEYIGTKDVYDMEVKKYNNFAANGIFIHNSNEDLKGIQFVGEAGQVLRKALNGIGIDLDRDCWKTNSISCRPLNNRTPTKREISLCRPRVLKVIEEKKPCLIILLGGTALESLISHRYKGKLGGITKWRGYVIPDQDIRTYIAPTFHPSYVLRSKGIPAIEKLFTSDLTRFVDYLDKPFPDYHEPKIRIIDRKKAADLLEVILRKNPSLLSFDYETTGLKPYAKGHEIVCCSVCFIRNIAHVFELKSKKVIRLWKTVLKDKQIPKSAQNIKFEHSWSKEILNTTVRAWKWDTMQASHIKDNRSGITGLKFQVYVNFGILPWGEKITPFFQAENGNAFNRIKEIPKDELMYYAGMDSLWQYRLAELQMEEIE